MGTWKHNLKCWPTSFKAIRRGNKSFDLRNDDRNFEVNDKILLREYDPEKESYTGAAMDLQVIYILRDFPGLEKGYCILGLKKDTY